MIEHVAGLEELNRSWSFDEIMRANEVMDAFQLAKAEASKPDS